MRETFRNITLKGLYFLSMVILLGLGRYVAEWVVGYYISAGVYWVVLLGIYVSFFLQIWIWMQEMGEECVRLEIQHYENKTFLEYQIEIEQK